MDLENFENDIFWQIFNENLNKIVQIFFLKIYKKLEGFFQEYFKNIFQKTAT
jgi:hypothetical protein